MKAAVLYKFGESPKYEEFPNPVPEKGEKLIQVKAAALENFDKMIAKGIHYSSKQMFPKFPAITGHGGVGVTEEGQLVGFGMMRSPYGAFAEKTVSYYTVPVPDGVDAAMAASLPASILTSYLPLKYTAKLGNGETVLVNGATGVTGKIAVQAAKMLGAGRIVGTGRNETSLRLLKDLGADAVINLKLPDEQLLSAYQNEAGEKGYDVVIDLIWGHPAEMLMKSFIPEEAGFAKKRIRYIHMGEKAGPDISLSGEMLRTSGLEIYGAGNIPQEAIPEAMQQVWQWIKENKFHIDIEKVPLADIEKVWQRNDLEGKRLVIVP